MSRAKSSEPRSRQLNISLTESEYAAIRGRAEIAGKRAVIYARDVLLRSETARSALNDPGLFRVATVKLELMNVGRSLNQMLRDQAAKSSPLPPDLPEVLARVRALLNKGETK